MKNLLKIPTNIKKRNAWFETLTAEQKRIVIAQDTITQIEIKKFLPSPRNYFTLGDNTPVDCTLQQAIDATTCSVCAMGAVFASRVRIGNNVEEFYADGDDIVDALQGIFEEEQLRLMEAAFEGDDITGLFEEEYGVYDELEDEYVIHHEPYTRALAMHDEHIDPSARLIAIMKNVIENNGVFKP